MSTYALQTKTMLQSLSKGPSQILNPTSKRDLDPKPQLPSKRKRESICGLGSFNKPFVIKPCPESPYDKPALLKPIRIIGRAQLPLTFLDTSAEDSFTSNRLFSASIEVLETHDRTCYDTDESPKVLIARYETTKALYAVERVLPRVFSLCKLAGWLKEKDVASLWDPASLDLYPIFPIPEVQPNNMVWWQRTLVTTEPVVQPTKRVTLTMLRPRTGPIQPVSKACEAEETAVLRPDVTLQKGVLDLPEVPMEAPTPQQQLETLVQQYLDAVYLSKTSLAYFAKGPITRIRAAFTSSEEGAPPTHELVTYLRSMLLSHKAGEKKYQEKLPEIVKSMPPGSYSDDEILQGLSKPKKSKKKIKLNREGVYPIEEDIVKKWWMLEMPLQELHGEETIEQRIKRRIGDLRVREALAQMILMLEIIALEALSTYKEPQEEQAVAGNGEIQGESQAKSKKRKKKLDDIKLQLDLLLDKLCIWQSVDQDGILDFDARPSNQGDATNNSSKGSSSDRLQGFCVEVIIPFYVSRLPEQAITINKKLGGPVHISPPKRKAVKASATSRKSGEPKEPDAKKSRRLERVVTDTAAQVAKRQITPSLHRSITDPTLMNGIKREASEVPLGAIPFQRSPSNAARQSLSHFKHLKGRQIDLSGPSAATAAKLKQKKRVEEDLKEAISALKKPNRPLAAGGYVDDIERRGLGSSSKSRKPATTVRKVLKDVQVTATPRVGKRIKSMIEHTPNRQYNPFDRDHDPELPPPSSVCIPSSGVRAAIVPGTVQRRATIWNRTAVGIAETPTKVVKSSMLLPPKDNRNAALMATPTKSRTVQIYEEQISTSPTAVFATPAKKGPAAPSPNITSTPPAIFSTPRKPLAATSFPESPLPAFLNPAKASEERDIFDALGWNDDDDLL